ncbi:hypothetical protein BG004_006122 [Podila humilis]|nr:hypothetical protein BG004_006122 [Podila humilis]
MTLGKKNVLIIGAGISGLAAAQELAKDPSVKVSILEARNRLGGRLDTRRNLIPLSHPGGGHVAASPETSSALSFTLAPGDMADIPIDFGASWIHGVDPTNPIVPLAEAAHARLVPTNFDVVYQKPGLPAYDQDRSNHYWSVLWDIFARAREFARLNRDRISVHTSFKTWFDHFLATRQSDSEHLPDYMSKDDLSVVPLLALFWADENAIELEKVSLKYMDAEKMFPGDHSIMATGYDGIVNLIARDIMANVTIHLEHVVDGIEYNDTGVSISTNKGIFTADIVLVTLPLGVLKSGSVTFSPPLPLKKQLAIQRLGFGTMVKVIMYFPTCFWPVDKHFINFLPSAEYSRKPIPALVRHLNVNQQEALSVYMQDLANYTSMMPIHGASILIGYATNAAAAAFGKLTDKEAMEVLFCQLSHYYDVLGKDPEAHRPTQYYMTRWCDDPYARGSYTSIPVGGYQSDLAEFEIPVGVRPTTVAHDDSSVTADMEELACVVDSLAITAEGSYKGNKKLAMTHGLKDQMGCLYGYESKNVELATGPRAFSNNNHALIIPEALLPEQRRAQEHSQGYLHQLNLGHPQEPQPQRILQEASCFGIPLTITIKGLKDVFFSLVNSATTTTAVTTIHNDFGIGIGHSSLLKTAEKKQFRHDNLFRINGKKIHRVESQVQPIGLHQTHRGKQQTIGFTQGSMNLKSGSKRIHLVASKTVHSARHDLHVIDSNKVQKTTEAESVSEDNVFTGRVFFAGEHTTPTSFASVHGALMTGRREAAKILAQTFRT